MAVICITVPSDLLKELSNPNNFMPVTVGHAHELPSMEAAKHTRTTTQTKSLPVLLQVKLAETQRLMTAANAELQQLRQQMQTLTTQEKTALGNKTRAAHRVAQLQVWVVCVQCSRGLFAGLW